MSGCAAIPPAVGKDKACSGKCMGGSCGDALRVWVVAVCDRMVSLFVMDLQGELSLLPDQRSLFSSPEQCQRFLVEAEYNHLFNQLVIVGSRDDLAWIHAAFPDAVTHHIVAEIEYPLSSSWFRQPLPMHDLSLTLKEVFAGQRPE